MLCTFSGFGEMEDTTNKSSETNTHTDRYRDRHFLLPAQLPGTHWAMICVIRHLARTVSDVCLKLSCFQST